ncbi:hypothetical protein N7520_006004 [Penicillium odoratum]|uniref:uncharacterized protein n=1 Tax=Penicillium odoratum TaxID=1167516 RepID=UPI0025485983|nr:uncharacterized protein N7520_006004 [Penicillium odoratum]KAJ5758848.1 hypothetical protein N7520_006004 [Penicillium odoratum]
MVGKLHIPWHYVAAYDVNGQLYVDSANFTNFLQFADSIRNPAPVRLAALITLFTPRVTFLGVGIAGPRNKPLLSSKPYIAGKLDTCANRRETA